MILLKNVRLTYPSTSLTILNDVNIHIAEGEWVSLIGPSGSGKTSFLKIVSGLVECTEGVVHINGMNIKELSINKRHEFIRNYISTVYQQFRLLPQFTVVENVVLPLIPYIKQKKELENRALELIEKVGLSHRIHHFPYQLSGGEQQRVAIARALVSDPSILLCDEPTGNLDTKNRDSILDLLSQIHKTGKTILLATHDNVVAKRGDSVITFEDGAVYKGVMSP
ncbi:ABC transporter ATP-binding protein [Alkalicoccobacillus gibsonii]|uniref:ABC transporter ATP-binding protein n=1 Tax=Alkalicoccobacillus gibsonii TaxID=79881 RepID=UPI001933FDC8|nr:ABC transporter ATP-binding protein [Alkalicoccobacillus gibsonii]MBM0066778.1 ABC transporter ATP-binding protein [Alkalicoccobacillus gibsonii]